MNYGMGKVLYISRLNKYLLPGVCTDCTGGWRCPLSLFVKREEKSLFGRCQRTGSKHYAARAINRLSNPFVIPPACNFSSKTFQHPSQIQKKISMFRLDLTVTN
jgi:hypothetical protein